MIIDMKKVIHKNKIHEVSGNTGCHNTRNTDQIQIHCNICMYGCVYSCAYMYVCVYIKNYNFIKEIISRIFKTKINSSKSPKE